MYIVTITNNKGGVGKTTLSSNIAVGLSMQNKKVLLIEIDGQQDLATSWAGVDGATKSIHKQKNTVKDALIDGSVPVSDAVINIMTNLDYIKGDDTLALSGNLTDLTVMARNLIAVRDNYDVVIIDTPPQIDTYVASAIKMSDLIIIPAEADLYAITGTIKTIQLIRSINDNADAIVALNKVNLSSGPQLRVIDDFKRNLVIQGVPVYTTIEDSLTVKTAINRDMLPLLATKYAANNKVVPQIMDLVDYIKERA